MEFNLFYSLFEAGNYHLIVREILDFLDLESIYSLSLVNRSCYKFLKPFVQNKRRLLRQSWLRSSRKEKVLSIQSSDIKYPSIVCDDTELILVAFDAKQGWSAHVFRISTLDLIFVQCLYRVDSDDLAWTQFIGNCTLSRRFLVITPTTAEHELHLWRRSASEFIGPPMVIKQQMSDRYANTCYDYYVIVYRSSLFSLYSAEKDPVVKCWSYTVYTGEYVEKMIMKVVKADKNGILFWERDIFGNHSLQKRDFRNKMIFKIDLDYFVQDDLQLKPNDIIDCSDSKFVIDFTNKHGSGVLDVVSYKNELLRRFEHDNKPHHGWVVHCRSVAPPKCLKSLNLVPFLQYALCLDLELMQMCKKDHNQDNWPLHTESVAYNSSDIFFTDHYNQDIVRIVRGVQEM